ncbi:MAG: hypothetical protein ACOC5T_07430 [Elusimicrobiota bacterium]
MKFGELEKRAVFIRNKRWYKKTSDKDSGKTVQSDGFGTATDERGVINFFGNNQKVKKYEFRQFCKW